MTVEEAITNLECLEQSETADLEDDEREAIRLGIEALKGIDRARKLTNIIPIPLLPGETDD
jgi:hypothetical protein